MRIIGIDPGLARVGYGIIDEIKGKKIMLDCGIIETKSKQKEENRLVEISNDLSSIINKWHPSSAAVEKFFFYRSSTTISVVQARGVIMMTLGKHNLPIQEFPPMQIKDILYFFISLRRIFSKFLFFVLIIKYGIEFFFAYKIPLAFILLETTRLILIGKF